MKYLFFIIFFFLFSCSNDIELVKGFIPQKDRPIEKIEGAEILHTEHGLLKVKVIASTIKRFQNSQPYLILSNGIQVIFYNDSTLMQSRLMSEDAEIDENTKIMIARNNVILISSKGEKLETQELVWDEKENKIYTDMDVKINTGREVIQGKGFISNPNFTEYSISKIHGTFNVVTSIK